MSGRPPSIVVAAVVLGGLGLRADRVAAGTVCNDTSFGECGILITNPNPINFGPVSDGATATRTYDVTNASSHTLAMWSFSIAGDTELTLGAPCTAGTTSCASTVTVLDGQTFAPQPVVQCTPTAGGTGLYAGMLTVSAMYMTTIYTAMAPVSCSRAMGATAEIDISPLSVDLTSPVGIQATGQFTVANQGTAPLMFTVVRVPFSGPVNEWSADCESGCTVAGDGSQVVTVRFTPTAVFDRGIDLRVTSNDVDESMIPIAANGIGEGGIVGADRSSIDFGGVPRDTGSALQRIRVVNTGNVPVAVTANTSADPDFHDVPSQAEQNINAGGFHDWFVECRPTMLGGLSGTFTVSAPTAVGTTTIPIPLTCTGISSSVLLSPATSDFGRVRVGQSAGPITVTISNAPGAPVVSLGVPDANPNDQGFLVGSLPVSSLAGGAMTSFTIDYLPMARGQSDAVIEKILVAEASRVIDLKGRGVVADYVVSPTALDLGSACVGAVVSSEVTLTATEDAVLRVEAPALADGSQFGMNLVMPTTYPADLDPEAMDHTAIADVTVTALPGPITDQLIWTTDRTMGDHTTVAITLEGIDSGLAVSPGMIEFGTVPVGVDAGARDVAVQLCGLAATSVTASLDGDAAFGLLGQPMAMIDSTQARPWSIRLSTATAGDFTGTLHLTPAGGATKDIPIHGHVGDLTGGGDDLGLTDYYACGCAAPLDAGGAVPGLIVIAFLALPRRRRRRRAR